MNRYVFTLHSIGIAKTRSLHEDTVHVAFSVKVGNQPTITRTLHMGDLNDGTYPVGLRIGPLDVPSSNMDLVLSYIVLNSGHRDYPAVEDLLNKGADELTKYAIEGGGVWGAVAAGAIQAIKEYVLPLFTADCDGIVAADAIRLDGELLKEWTQGGKSMMYPGSDSPHGCFGNSEYWVRTEAEAVKAAYLSETVIPGPWWLNANGFGGEMELNIGRVDESGQLINTTFLGQRVSGFWNEGAQCIRFVREVSPGGPGRIQAFTGYFLSDALTYNLVGSFVGLKDTGASARHTQYPWRAFKQKPIVMG